MVQAVLRWLDRLDGYQSHVVAADGHSFRSAGLPVTDEE
jgi:hypothetical protein